MMVSDLFYEDMIKLYTTICSLKYTTESDPGNLLNRFRNPCMDIDLRSVDGKLFLQFYGVNYVYVYVFEWTKDIKEFLQIMKDVDINDTETLIDTLISIIMDSNDKRKYITLKYGLK